MPKAKKMAKATTQNQRETGKQMTLAFMSDGTEVAAEKTKGASTRYCLKSRVFTIRVVK